MTLDDFDKLCSHELFSAINDNIGRKAESVALQKGLPSPALVATQVKYLRKAASKLPTYFAARCIIPPLSFEQASSEVVAAHKQIEGESILDLTCGLGVDSLHFSRKFRKVVALERSEVLAAVARENFRRMGISNVEVVCCEAEEYLASCSEEFDWVYADPDRRGAQGQKLVLWQDASPNVLALKPQIERVARCGLMLKASPLFDIDEAFRLFSPSRVEVVSLGGECKEVVVSSSKRDVLVATAINRGSVELERDAPQVSPRTEAFDPERYRYLIIPDVALQKARLVAHALEGVAHVWSNNGFGFACDEPPATLLGRTLTIERVERYNPKALRRELSGARVEILKRDFALSTAQIVGQLKIKEGGSRKIAFTTVNKEQIAIFVV